MFTILQRQPDFSYNVVAKVINKDIAIRLASELCNSAGVIRTIVIDEWGSIVSIES